MRKFTRKPKPSTIDISQPYLGVRTRAKTLALQRRQSTDDAALPPSKSSACYLELRSRRLEKPMQLQNSRVFRHGCGCEGPQSGRREGVSREGRVSGLEIQASFGENNLDFEGGESVRGTRESTPCSFIKAADTITTLGSTTKKPCSVPLSQKSQNEFLANVPSSHELEEFFDRAEQSVQRSFLEKYDFDFAKDVPLPGRYEHRTML